MSRSRYQFIDLGLAVPRRPTFEIRYSPSGLTVELSVDSLEAVLTFDVVQAVRITTEDAYPFTGSEPRGLAEVIESPWLVELAEVVRRTDEDADFMAHSHHYFLQGYDDVLEVAAFDVTVRRVG